MLVQYMTIARSRLDDAMRREKPPHDMYIHLRHFCFLTVQELPNNQHHKGIISLLMSFMYPFFIKVVTYIWDTCT